MRFAILGAALVMALALSAGSISAAERAQPDDVYAASKSAELEGLRMRLSNRSSATATLMEAQDALRRYREAKPENKNQARATLDATMARLEMEANLR